MKLAIYKANNPSDYIYTFSVYKKVHGKWSRVRSVDDLSHIHLNNPSTIRYTGDVRMKVYGSSLIYFGNHTLLKTTLPEYFI